MFIFYISLFYKYIFKQIVSLLYCYNNLFLLNFNYKAVFLGGGFFLQIPQLGIDFTK